MAVEVRNFAIQIPAGTLKSAPQTTAVTMPARIVTGMRWRVPPGNAGNVGFQVAVSGVNVIPWGAGQWIVADNEWDEIQLSGMPDSGAWQLIGYNTGSKPHTVYLTFYLDTLGASSSAVANIAPVTVTASVTVSTGTPAPAAPVSSTSNSTVTAPAPAATPHIIGVTVDGNPAGSPVTILP